jgi:hypothetical protein
MFDAMEEGRGAEAAEDVYRVQIHHVLLSTWVAVAIDHHSYSSYFSIHVRRQIGHGIKRNHAHQWKN